MKLKHSARPRYAVHITMLTVVSSLDFLGLWMTSSIKVTRIKIVVMIN